MNAEFIMNRQPVTLNATDTVGHATDLLLRHRLQALPVVGDDGHFVGIFSITRLLQLLLPKAATVRGGLTNLTYVHDAIDDLRARLQEINTRAVGDSIQQRIQEVGELAVGGQSDDTVTVVHPATPLMETLLILYHTHDNLPVVDEESGRLLGIVSYSDVVQKLAYKD
ncbi:MAG: hypothetical protein B7Z66_00395 [Chromatiales bacterium 21-64-14]|nr:MAG: hypothetical protein B7Z66_00395 [Chromatiales bacterium 21-64-14]HQU16433.1 CBS domain-containing protein [Gammaproteobacteria bacterium]